MSNKSTIELLLKHKKEILNKRREAEGKVNKRIKEEEEEEEEAGAEERENMFYTANRENQQTLLSEKSKLQNIQNDFMNKDKLEWKKYQDENNAQIIHNMNNKYKEMNSVYKGFNYTNNMINENVENYNLFKSNSNYNINWIYDIKLNSLLASKDNLTVYNVTDYLTFYSLLNIIGIGIKFHFFKTALKLSNHVFQYISEDNVISVHFRLMLLAMYTCKKWAAGYFLKPLKVKSDIEQPYINFLYTQQSYNFEDEETTSEDTSGESDETRKKRFLSKKKNFIAQMPTETKQNNISSSVDLTDSNNDSKYDVIYESDADEFIHYFSIDPDYLANENLNDYFFHYRKMDIYKKTYQTCSTILNDYFVYLHPLHLDFYLSLAWCNKCARNYREFLFLIHTVILLQTRMCLKNSSEEKMEHLKLSDDFDSILSSTFSDKLNDDRFIIEGSDKKSYFFLNDICTPHETTFLKDNVKLIPRTKSFYNIRLAYTLHYFANSLFYYYNTNKIMKAYKGGDFILNKSVYCINILEKVKTIFQFFNAKSVNVARVSIDVSLMILKLICSEKIAKIDSAKMMTYALSNVKSADEILKYNYGINHIDSLYCQYVLSLIYMYLDQKTCIYTFEEIIYYLLNYNYKYNDRNIVSEIFWYFPEHIATLRCINGKGFLNTYNIKCYLFNVYLNLFIPDHYLKKIMKIMLLLYSIDIFKNKKDIALFERYNYLCDMSFCSYEKVLSFLKGYKYILSKKSVFVNISDYEELLKNNKNIVKSEKKITKEKSSKTIKKKEKVLNFYDHVNFVSTNSYKNNQENEIKDLEEFWGISKNDEAFISKNENQKVKKYKSITAQYIKKMIKRVERKVELLYNEAKKQK